PRIAAVGQGIQHSENPPQSKLVGSVRDYEISLELYLFDLKQTYIAWMVLYGISVSLSKCAILLLYIRVFTTRLRIFTIVIYAVGTVVIATGLATVFGSIFQCTPISRNWDASVQGACIDKIKFARFTALPNVITGFAMLVIPMPLVWQLNIAVQQKIALTATFLHGIIGFVASLARLIILSQPAKTNTISWIAISWTIWTVVEPANYVIAACLPTLRPILVRVLPPSFFILTHQRTRKYYSSFKFSWPKGRRAPKISLASKDIHGASHITGPWDSSRAYWEQDIEATDPTSFKSAGLETESEKTLEVSRSPTLR
ncbi:MAG: hypothetical protein Q9214_005030, partial [Letrouitia sp. 1 TL-2023]